MDTLITPVWSKKAVKMSGFNLFVKTNIDVFDDTGALTDYTNLKLAVGDLPLPTSLAIQLAGSGNGAITVTWVDNSGTGIADSTDRLRIAAMSNGELVLISGLVFNRNAQQANVQLPFAAGSTAHVYAFFENEGKSKYSADFHAQVVIPVPTP